MVLITKIGICGLGLIGGSIAKALKIKSCEYHITALDSNISSLKTAFDNRVIDRYDDADYSVFADCDIVFVCTPIYSVIHDVEQIRRFSQAIITDTASTKLMIMAGIDDDKFIGGHPMAGSEKSGYSASSDTLFENAVYALVRNDNVNENDFNAVYNIVNELGAIPLEISAYDHDDAVGTISHLPHLIASAMVNTVLDSKNSRLLSQLAAGGFKDITRIASSEPDLWKQIILSSDKCIQRILLEFSHRLKELADIIARKDSESLTGFLSSAKDFRSIIADNKVGLISSQATLYVEVSDKPGIIGEIATLLGNNNINIKNLYIENNREYEGGSLRITLEHATDSGYATSILVQNGFSCKVI